MVAVAAAAMIATPVQAVAGLQYVSSSTVSDSSTSKALTVFCPTGTAAISGGAYLTGATGSAIIRQIAPFRGRLGLYGVYVVADEDPDGYDGSWSLSATAVCVPTPAGIAYVSQTAADPALLWVTADCGAKRIIGSGYKVSSTALMMAAGAELNFNRAYLSVEPSRVPGAVVPVTGTAIAVCADASLPGLRTVEVRGATDSVNGKTTFAVCPSGTQVVGVGGGLVAFRGHTVIDDFTIASPTYAYITGYEDQGGNPQDWSVAVTAVCAD